MSIELQLRKKIGGNIYMLPKFASILKMHKIGTDERTILFPLRCTFNTKIMIPVFGKNATVDIDIEIANKLQIVIQTLVDQIYEKKIELDCKAMYLFQTIPERQICTTKIIVNSSLSYEYSIDVCFYLEKEHCKKYSLYTYDPTFASKYASDSIESYCFLLQ